jgi:SOS-response transcriptional repressor LexA
VPAGQPLHDIITATDSNQVRVTLNTKGKLEMLSAENELVTLDYTPETLANTVDLALRLAPGQTLSSYQQFVERFPVYPFLINYVNQFFYRYLPLQLSVILIPQQ